ncbi:MAG: hypothetical protein DRN95_07420 [Candidatus Hydrothermarchaeota archaeon]|nr:MAG: hypothetical protein DRN95_07420 [Candidatus Hydrothermarchaeota archaeon]
MAQNNKPKIKIKVDKQKKESYLKTILMGMLTAIALFTGQWLVHNTIQLLIATVLSFVIFGVVSALYLLKREIERDKTGIRLVRNPWKD